LRRELFEYELPLDRIASRPTAERDGGRLLVLSGEAEPFEHLAVRDLPRLLPPGALLVVNDTRVVPARLLGHKRDSGGRVEIFLVRSIGSATVEHGSSTFAAERWRALGRSSKPLRPGAAVVFGSDGALEARIVGRQADDLLDVELWSPARMPIADALEKLGHVPLPPYVRREDDADDRARYQTVFARVPGAVAAPTAGLHLSETLLERLREAGVELASVTLHVGLGTFQPVTAEDLDEHPMHAETFDVPEATALAIERARTRRAPVVAVGTTVVRALEAAADAARPGRVRGGGGETRLLIQPGYRFRVVDQLMTNFHLPGSTLLALVAAFGGRERVLAAYQAAIAEGYRFYSYGDAMLLRTRDPSGGSEGK